MGFPMNCTDILDQLSAYLDRELPLDRQWQVEQHLRECAACARELEDLREVVAAVTDLPRVKVPAGFAAGVREKLTTVEPERPRTHWLARFKGPVQGLAAVAALLLIYSLNRGAWEQSRETHQARMERPPDFPVKQTTVPTEELAREDHGGVSAPAGARPAAAPTEEMRKLLEAESAVQEAQLQGAELRSGKKRADDAGPAGDSAADQKLGRNSEELAADLETKTKNLSRREKAGATSNEAGAAGKPNGYLADHSNHEEAKDLDLLKKEVEETPAASESWGSEGSREGEKAQDGRIAGRGENRRSESALKGREAEADKSATETLREERADGIAVAPARKPSPEAEQDRVAQRGGYDAGRAFGGVARVDKYVVYTPQSVLPRTAREIETRVRALSAEVVVETPEAGRRNLRVTVSAADAERVRHLAQQYQSEGLARRQARERQRQAEAVAGASATGDTDSGRVQADATGAGGGAAKQPGEEAERELAKTEIAAGQGGLASGADQSDDEMAAKRKEPRAGETSGARPADDPATTVSGSPEVGTAADPGAIAAAQSPAAPGGTAAPPESEKKEQTSDPKLRDAGGGLVETPRDGVAATPEPTDQREEGVARFGGKSDDPAPDRAAAPRENLAGKDAASKGFKQSAPEPDRIEILIVLVGD